jgi:P27 family predicted phage terminase small subunit
MEIVGKGSGNDVLSQVPTPPNYLDGPTKRHYKKIAKALIGAKVLKTIHLSALEILAQNSAQFEFAVKAIHKKNNQKSGTGYIQVFKTGAANITPEVSLKEKAENRMLQVIKQFGLDPKSEKDLDIDNAGQTNLLEALGLGKKTRAQ